MAAELVIWALCILLLGLLVFALFALTEYTEKDLSDDEHNA